MRMMAKEGRLGKLYRQDWPAFLNRLVPGTVWQALSARCPQRDDPRRRWTLKYILLCWVAMGWSRQGQLTERFREGRELLAGLFYRRRRAGASYQGLLKASAGLGVGVFQQFWECLRKTLPSRLGPLWFRHGWNVLAVDGSRCEAPRTRANERGLGCAGRHKTAPQWWITWLVHLPSGLIWDWRQGPGNSSERAHLRDMLAGLPASALLVGDAGFGGFDFLWTLSRAGVAFLVRGASNTTLLSDARAEQIERMGEHRYVYLWPLDRQACEPLRLRLIVLKRAGRRVYLLTNVFESQRLSRAVAGEFYEARWGIEVNYRSLKQTLGRRRILAKTPAAGALELAANILALALLLYHGAMALGARVGRLSVGAALKTLRRAMESLRFGAPTGWFFKQLRAALRDTYHRRSRKRAHDWPHKKSHPPPNPPIVRSPTTRENALINLWSLYHELRLG